MESKKQTKQPKRTYEKPALRTIELAAEEVLATGCKVLGQQAAGPSLCNSFTCSGLGS